MIEEQKVAVFQPLLNKFETEEMRIYCTEMIKQIPNYISSYVSITSENYDDSVIAATMMKKELNTPLEKILTGNGNS